MALSSPSEAVIVMKRLLLLPILVLTLFAPQPAWAHPNPSSAVVLRLGSSEIRVELTLPLVELAMGWEKSFPADPSRVVAEFGPELGNYVRSHVRATSPDGRPWSITVEAIKPLPPEEQSVRVELKLSPPPGAPVDRLTLHYDVILHHLITHDAVVSLASDWRGGLVDDQPILLGTFRDTDPAIIIDRSSGSWGQGFVAMFRLGMRHIAEGTDHLLFLLALILPAPLLVVNRRWTGAAKSRVAFGRIVKLVTAFTVGHSLTLLLGALGWVSLPSTLIESLIAFSIIISAVHAMIPVFRGRETLIAGGFGLVHGLAFASTLTEFGFDPWTMVSSVLGFNLGIEAIQVVVILAVMPWLVLLARTRIYRGFRLLGSLTTAVAAFAWLGERALGWPNPVEPWVEAVAAHPTWLLLGLALLTLLARADLLRSSRGEPGSCLQPALEPELVG